MITSTGPGRTRARRGSHLLAGDGDRDSVVAAVVPWLRSRFLRCCSGILIVLQSAALTLRVCVSVCLAGWLAGWLAVFGAGEGYPRPKSKECEHRATSCAASGESAVHFVSQPFHNRREAFANFSGESELKIVRSCCGMPVGTVILNRVTPRQSSY